METGIIALIPFLVLLGAVFNGTIALLHAHDEETPDCKVTWIGCFAPILSFIFSCWSFCKVKGGAILTCYLYNWFTAGDAGSAVAIDFALRVDELTSVMLLVVTGVGSLIHIYSMGYMHGDKGYARFYAYLNLFMFFMLMLVMGDSMVVLFLGWEGVGLASYLLISFWWEDGYKADCGKKAFIVNRIGDLGFLLGMFALFSVFGTLNIHGVKKDSPSLHESVTAQAAKIENRDVFRPNADPEIVPHGVFKGWRYANVFTLAALLLFLGACGKSAQIPLFVWLPDAMAGPTPVSALIHAATMVTAGVYMVARMGFLYSQSTAAMAVVACVGALTALIAASMGLVQNDIKKVLAYSTVSQLGFMFIAVGVGAYSTGIFHLFTHAFFKACLFLGAGSVIHGMHHEQDIRKMGGLKEFMPHTYWTFLLSSIAIAGIFPFAGFFSKDHIMLMAFSSHTLGHLGKFLWGVAFIAAGMTAFYMFRLVFLTFHGQCRAERKVQHHIHESPFSMVSVLWLLAIGSVLVGLFGRHHGDPFGAYVDQAVHGHEAHPSGSLALLMAVASVLWALAWILAAKHFYLDNPEKPKEVAEEYDQAYQLLNEKFYVDTLYDGGIVQPIWAAAKGFLFKIVDVKVIDGVINALGVFVRLVGEILRIFHTGAVRTYVAFLLFGAIVFMWLMVS